MISELRWHIKEREYQEHRQGWSIKPRSLNHIKENKVYHLSFIMEDYKARRNALYKGTYKKRKSKRDLHQVTPSWKMKGTMSQVIKQVHLKKETWITSRYKEGKPSSLQEESKFTTSQTLSSKYMSPFEYTLMSFCNESNKLVGTIACPKSNDLDAKNMDTTKGIVLN